MLKKLIVFAITSGLAAKWYKAYASKASKASKTQANGPTGGLDAQSRKRSPPAQL